MADDSFARIEISNLEGRAQSTSFRQKLLHSLHTTLRSSETIIKNAIRADTGHTDSEIVLEYNLAISELRTHYESLSLEEDLKNQRVLENLTATTNVGIVYITSLNRNMLYSVISSVSAALAAGNCVVLEVFQG